MASSTTYQNSTESGTCAAIKNKMDLTIRLKNAWESVATVRIMDDVFVRCGVRALEHGRERPLPSEISEAKIAIADALQKVEILIEEISKGLCKDTLSEYEKVKLEAGKKTYRNLAEELRQKAYALE